MSYILDALKKSDQQRQRGITPTLPPAQAAVAQNGKNIYYALLAAVCGGAAIGWLHPWQAEHAVSPPPVPGATPVMSVQELPQPAPKKLQPAAPDAKAGLAAKAETLAPQAVPATELPEALQKEIPPMAIQLHAYSSKPAERVVSINSHMLFEGGLLAPGIKLEEITPEGMIFSYKGYRFVRGVR